METTNGITHFSVLLRSDHQTLSNHMLFASLPFMCVLFVVTKFVALLYDKCKQRHTDSTKKLNDFLISILGCLP